MIINPIAKTILCYGDSNTWGQSDDKNVSSRRRIDERWPGILQELLGKDYNVIEEGLGGRTTNLDQVEKPYRNGLDYYIPCLATHSPNIVIIMLGTNDLKIQFSRNSNEIAGALRLFVDKTRAIIPETKILLVSPIHINSNAPKFKEYYSENYNEESAFESENLAQSISSLAKESNVYFFDASTVSKAGIDGIHFDKESHAALAQALKEVIVKLF